MIMPEGEQSCRFMGFRRNEPGTYRKFGQNKDYQYEYEVYVHKEDYKKAKYLIRK